MTPRPIQIGSRDSRLARIQANGVLDQFRRILPDAPFEPVWLSSPGDRDRQLDLRASPPDFFTRDLDDALLQGAIDAAVHSAKDMPDPVRDGLDWVWLPWREDPRDGLVLTPGQTPSGLPSSPILGVSSHRRADWCRLRFPGARLRPIRGNIEDRLAQVDSGAFDGVVMAAAALIRLGLQDRITEWIPAADTLVPDGQGVLALAFRSGDSRFLRLRRLFVKPVAFVGAGCGTAESCTQAGLEALREAEVCLHDALIDSRLLEALPPEARRIDVGKRAGSHRMEQEDINRLLVDQARRGLRVVRLKGGDPGIFGRLAEELDALDRLHLPSRLVPGVSSLSAATTGTGMLLTQRGVSSGFTVSTPRRPRGEAPAVSSTDVGSRVFFMAAGMLAELAGQLRTEGVPGSTPAAVVYDAGSPDETLIRSDLDHLPSLAGNTDRPGIVLVGACVQRRLHPEWSALRGLRVLLPGSEGLQEKSKRAVRDGGGIPIPFPLFHLTWEPSSRDTLRSIASFDWIVVTSPSSARFLLEGLKRVEVDIRALPPVLVAGPGTADVLKAAGIRPDAVPGHAYGSEGVVETVQRIMPRNASLLRLRSDAAGPALADRLRSLDLRVTDGILYRLEPLKPDRLPTFDAVFFASASAVEAFLSLPGATLAGKALVVMGNPTLSALAKHGIHTGLAPAEPSVEGALQSLAVHLIREEWPHP